MMQSSKDKKLRETGHTTPDSPETSYHMADATILGAINALCADLQITKVKICQTIDIQIKEVATTIRGELSALSTETHTAIQTLQIFIDQHD